MGLSDFSLPLLVLAPISFFSLLLLLLPLLLLLFGDLWAIWPCLPSTSRVVMRPSVDMRILVGTGLTAGLRGTSGPGWTAGSGPHHYRIWQHTARDSPRNCSELVCGHTDALASQDRSWKGAGRGPSPHGPGWSLGGTREEAGKNSLMDFKSLAEVISPKTIFVYPKEPRSQF